MIKLKDILKEKDDKTAAVYNFKGHTFFAGVDGVSDKNNKFYEWRIIEFLYKVGKKRRFIK